MRTLPVVAVAAILLGACSSDAATTTTPSSPPETVGSPTVPETTPDTVPGTDPVTPVTAGGELTDSWTGVTKTTIKLGVAGIDPDQVRALGVAWDGPGAEELYQAWIDAQNDRGGVLGRNVELAFAPYLPIGDAQAEAACVALTEDDKVFAATGLLLGDTSLCITETHETPYIGLFGQSAERDARAKAPFLAIEMADDLQRSAGVQSFIERGLLEGKKVGLYTEAQDVAVTDGSIKPLLDDAGVDVVVSAVLDDFGDDTAAQDQALDAIVAKMQSEGVEVVLNVSNFTNVLVAFQRNGWFPEQVLATSAQAISADFVAGSGVDASSLADVLVAAPYIPSKEELVADPLVVECVDEFNASGPEEPIDLNTIEASSLNGIANQCAAFRLFVQVAEKAGVDLTPETFGAAADALGTVELPGVPFGSLTPTKHSVGDAIGIYDYDDAPARFLLDGDPIQVS